ncbi:hypothetical protein BAUCODRAFT_74823 [Baudoinia panamericana UAMH 10762]|uniref:YDG domain-containing protein n=1 Tax=Baudoinia panamericana (strain UAMH 10762) TaxID=717646 RepID=M2N476_BAUPA|nr:uncharacterized protein BAUCODRAFT_74823 [Baudoinia panamericana UAMH 10762]EMC93824.1 hypothetical protein BAUCODRAFT_74823 [Baudoinia panamericana UAMH 10762]
MSKQSGEPPKASSNRSKAWYNQLDEFLTFLEERVRMTPEVKRRSEVDLALRQLYARPEYKFPKSCAGRAEALYHYFEQAGWDDGGTDGADGDEQSEEPAPKRAKKERNDSAAPRGGSPSTSIVRYPPPNHSIWGINGIMHGVARKTPIGNTTGRRVSDVFDDRYRDERRDPKVFGHNGIEVGQWYPTQLFACFHGAHGHLQAGISGDADSGAYSVVVSGQYEELDNDRGNYLYYSGSGSHKNTDPRKAADSTPGMLALKRSLQTRKPVRVLRTWTGKSRYVPYCGLRYDGLYTVVTQDTPKNAKGGMYEQFALERLGGQPEIDQGRPNAKEMRDYARIANGYPAV